MKPISAFSKIMTLVYHPKYSVSYYPEEKLKGKWAILFDNLFWLFKNKEVNKYYYIYGLDRKHSNISNEVLSYKKFMQIRDGINLKPKGQNFNYAALLRDKFVFGQFLSSLKYPTPKNIALLDNGNITWLETMKTETLAGIAKEGVLFDGFCKKLSGLMGEGAFPLKVINGTIYSGDKLITVEELRAKMRGQYLWQERIVQNEHMSKIHPQSVNTVRLITFNNNGNIELFSATLRVGTHGRPVDNWSAGGIAVGVDIDTGKARKKGIYKPGYGASVEIHPNSNIPFLGFQIPMFEEIIELTKRLHGYFYGVHSIGWDIAFTPSGPVFVEGNDDWDGCMPMSFEENFKEKFLKMYV